MPNFYSVEYGKIARTLRGTLPPLIFNAEHTQHYRDCLALADMLILDNPNFNRNTFLLACGYSGDEKPRTLT